MTDQIDPGATGNSKPVTPPTQPAAPANAATATATKKAGWFATSVAASKAFFAPKQQDSQQQNTALSTVPTNQELATKIEQVAISSDMPLELIVAMLSGETQDVKDVIDGIEDDKETWIGHIVGRVVTVICYVLPWIISAYAGSALGQKYAGVPFTWNDASSAYYYIVSWGYEFALVALMTALVRVFKRMANGTSRRAGGVMVGVLALFILLASTSAAAQWILFEKSINTADPSQLIGALFRTLATPLIDLVGATVLAILHVKSLDQAIAVIQKKTEATININKKKIEAKLQTVSQAMEVKNMLQKEEDYAKKNKLANDIIEMFSEKAMDVIKANLEGRGNGSGGNQSRW
jgi:hypothetical protein